MYDIHRYNADLSVSLVLERFRPSTIADGFLRSRSRIVALRRARSCEMSCEPLRAYKRASAAFSGRDYHDYYRGPRIFPARGITHAAVEWRRGGDGRTERRDYSELSNDRSRADCPPRYCAIALACPRNAITPRYSSVLSLAIIGK